MIDPDLPVTLTLTCPHAAAAMEVELLCTMLRDTPPDKTEVRVVSHFLYRMVVYTNRRYRFGVFSEEERANFAEYCRDILVLLDPEAKLAQAEVIELRRALQKQQKKWIQFGRIVDAWDTLSEDGQGSFAAEIESAANKHA